MVNLCVVWILFIGFMGSLSLNAQENRKDMDLLLQKELGIEPKRKVEPELNPKPDGTLREKTPNTSVLDKNRENLGNREGEEANPVLERYATADDSGSTAWLLVKIILVFGGLTFVMVYILKVMSRTKNSRYPVRDAISILSSLAVGTNKQIQIVEVADKLLVVGVADSGISLLTEITSIDEKHRLLRKKEEFQPSQENFLVTLLESFKELSPTIPKSGMDTSSLQGSGYGSGEGVSSSEDLVELERKHRETLDRLRSQAKNLGFNNET